jgi:putative spermidine/putrescine transport system substrate-binding protein
MDRTRSLQSTERRRVMPLVGAAAALLLLAACNSPASTPGPAADVCARSAQSAADCGGIDKLVAAARSEGTLNVIALPRDWANYGALLDGFQAKYGIKINSENPNGSTPDELDAITKSGSSAQAPDVLDLRIEAAAANVVLFAPYKVATWSDIPDGQKDANAQWFEDYGGYMSIGYDSNKIPTVNSIEDFFAGAFGYKVSIMGDPNNADSALGAVVMASLAEGGTSTSISKGVAYFHTLKTIGKLSSLIATPKTINGGTTPLVFDWDYLAVERGKGLPSWRVMIPDAALVGGFYAQAINKNGPHPAAARLWEEYLYSDAGQNLWLQGGVRPVRMPAMESAGTLDGFAASSLPPVVGVPVYLSPDQVAVARSYLATHWASAVS